LNSHISFELDTQDDERLKLSKDTSVTLVSTSELVCDFSQVEGVCSVHMYVQS